MKKLIYILCASFMMLFSSCSYEDEINDIYDHLEQLEGSKIPMLEQQIGGINASLTELNAVDEALRQLISELSNKQEELQNQIDNNAAADAAEKAKLEKELKDLKALIASLQSKDEELTQQIEELQNFVNNEISGLQNWAEGTFATLEQYVQMQTELAAIKGLIGDTGGDIEQFTQAISGAIEASETSMKAWVNSILAEGYYDIAEIDGKLAALLAMIEEGDAELKKDIEDQKAALELAKAELTEAYKKAIEEAINNNNGAINKAIADAVQKALDKVETKLAVIENAIAAIQKDIENIKSSIASLEQQIESINASLTELNAVDEALRQLISELSNKQEELQNQIDNNAAADAAEKAKLEKELKDLKALIASLQSKDEELTQQIEELQNYVNNEISGLHDWAEGTFATLEQYVQMQTELAAIKALIDSYGGNMGQFTQAISEAIETSEASMKTWVNNLLAEGYYDIAEIDGKLAALLAMIEEGDAELKKDIEDQKAALELAKAELTEAYKKAIEEAINNNNGAINKAIADAVQKALDKVETKLAVIENAIAAIQKDIENIKSSIASLEQQIESINASLTELNAVDEALRQLISELSNKQEELQNQIDNNAAADAVEKAKLEKELKDLKALIASLQSKDEELTQQIEELQNYVNNEISGLHDWAEGTFATLEQYAQMQTELAAIKGLIGDTGGDIEQFTQAISGAIEASETSMKAWVNSILAEGYYDIAEIDAKLDALRSELTNADTEILKKLATQQAALEQAKNQLTDAYEKAIAKAIEENNGVIDAKIESAVQAATSALQDQINVISSAIANMQAQLDMIASRIQSVTYIPQYSDGKIKFSYTEKTTEVYLRISPAVLASKIETSMVKAFARYTDDPITRSLNDELPISVSLAAGDGTTGILHVCLAEDTANKLSDAFWSGDAEAIIYIQISDGNSNIVSPYIPVVAHGYVSNSADIGGFDDGSDTTGTVM